MLQCSTDNELEKCVDVVDVSLDHFASNFPHARLRNVFLFHSVLFYCYHTCMYTVCERLVACP